MDALPLVSCINDFGPCLKSCMKIVFELHASMVTLTTCAAIFHKHTDMRRACSSAATKTTATPPTKATTTKLPGAR